jgi:hypothetical protein
MDSENLKRRSFTISVHYLGHIAYMIRRLGPVPSYSCRSLERTISHYKQRTLSTQLPGISYRKLQNSIQANGPLLLISSLACHHLHDVIELMLENELHINHVLCRIRHC